MNTDSAQKILDQLYADVDGFQLSMAERKQRDLSTQALVYGEIDVQSFADILKTVQPKIGEVFYDLGCGVGKPVFAAHLLHNFEHCIGIELLDSLYKKASEILTKYEKDFRPSISPEKDGQKVSFIHSDFMNTDLTPADVVYIASTCFDYEFMDRLSGKLATSLKKGSRIVTLTKKLNHTNLQLRNTESFPMSWGTTTVHFYEKP